MLPTSMLAIGLRASAVVATTMQRGDTRLRDAVGGGA